MGKYKYHKWNNEFLLKVIINLAKDFNQMIKLKYKSIKEVDLIVIFVFVI